MLLATLLLLTTTLLVVGGELQMVTQGETPDIGPLHTQNTCREKHSHRNVELKHHE